jgi:hypothetical protein
MNEKTKSNETPEASKAPKTPAKPDAPVKEIGGRGGHDPVRYGDWEIGGKCVDF